MDRRTFLVAAGTMAAGWGLAGPRLAEGSSIGLPSPLLPGGKNLQAALMARRSRREFDSRAVPAEVLSMVLWAGWGVNRPKSGKRTAPSAHNRQEAIVYVATARGVYRYEAKDHRLEMHNSADLRAATGEQAYVAQAPVNLVYVSDMTQVAGKTEAERLELAAVDIGCICQNVSLCCAALDLASVVRASFDRDALTKALELPAGQRVMLAHSLGFPKA